MVTLNAWAAPSSPVDLDDELGHTVANTYNHLAKSSNRVSSLASIREQLEKKYHAEDYAGTFTILATNHALDVSYLDDPDMQAVIHVALQLYCHNQVEVLLADAQQQANRLAEAKLVFELARFYANNEHWSKVINLLSDYSLFEQLSKSEVAEAYVLQGTALQKQKKHRESIPIYEKVTAGSKHFRLAQLNLASAYIRQDWWTDAHSAINAALQQNQGKRDALDYRLYTVMGFSQIQFGFYRDARESFRHVAISSSYAQRALLGLGVAALHQQDFIGALNAFDKLRAQQQHNISIAEAHLLSAFTLRQLEQFDAATSRYQEAINYYQTLSNSLNTQMNVKIPTTVSFLRPENTTDKLLRNNSRKLALLEAMTQSNPAAAEIIAINNIKNKINVSTNQHIDRLLREEKETIDSYLSQSQFGLASLYDKK